MSYRDDVDALYERAATLQRELAHAQAELAQRDAELAAARGPWQRGPAPAWQPPALQPPALQPPAMQPPATASEPTGPRVAMAPDPAWLGAYRARLLEAASSRLDALDPESLVLVGAIIEELAVEPGHRPDILDRLRPIVRYIARR